MSQHINKQLTKEEFYFLAKYYRDTEVYEEMFTIINKMIEMKLVSSYKEFHFLQDIINSYINKKSEYVMKLRALESNELINNKSYSGYIKELLIIQEEELRRKSEEMFYIIDKYFKSNQSSYSDETVVLILNMKTELFYCKYLMENSDSSEIKSNLMNLAEESFKKSQYSLKNFHLEYLKSVLFIAKIYHNVLENTSLGYDFLNKIYKSIILKENDEIISSASLEALKQINQTLTYFKQILS